MQIRQIFFFVFLFSLFAAGCSSTYVKKDFPSDSAFINKINSYSGTADIVTKNDSLFKGSYIKVENDSVKSKTLFQKVTNGNKQGDYYGSLSMGTGKSSVPLSEVKNISLTSHSGNSAAFGFLTGAAAGGLLSGIFLKMGYDSNSGHHTYGFFKQALPGAIAGGVAGFLAGLFIGDKDLFIFENSIPKAVPESKNYHPRLGLRAGYISGFNYSILNMDGVNEYYGHVSGTGTPGFAVSLLYNYPLSSLFSFNSELSFVSTGSEAITSVKIPGVQDFHYTDNHSDEKLNIVELALPGRFNFLSSSFSPYILAGPKLDMLSVGKSGISSFLNQLKHQYDFGSKIISAKYNQWILGLTFGGGLSTGNTFPVEFLIEARYNYDLTPRFEMNYIVPASNNPFYIIPDANTRMPYRSSEFQLNLGAAIF